MEVILFFLALMVFYINPAEQNHDIKCVVRSSGYKCKISSECQIDFKCVLTPNCEKGSCYPVCAGKRGLECTTGRCCYQQTDGTYTTSQPTHIIDEQGVCL